MGYSLRHARALGVHALLVLMTVASFGVLAQQALAGEAQTVIEAGEAEEFIGDGSSQVFTLGYRGDGKNWEMHELPPCDEDTVLVTVTNLTSLDVSTKGVFDPAEGVNEQGVDDWFSYEFGCVTNEPTSTTTATTTTTTTVPSTTVPSTTVPSTTVPPSGGYAFPGGLSETDFAAVYDAREFGVSSGDISIWPDLTGNGRDLITKLNGGDPSVTTEFFGGERGVRFDVSNRDGESMQYWTGTNFYTGDIGIVMVMHPVTVPEDSHAYLSASFGGSISNNEGRDYQFKHAIGVHARDGSHEIVVMNGDGGPDHGYYGTVTAGRAYVITSYIREGHTTNRHWLGRSLGLEADNGDNDLDGWGIGSRETGTIGSGGTKYADGAIGFLAFVQMDGLTEADLLRVRDEVASGFGVEGF